MATALALLLFLSLVDDFVVVVVVVVVVNIISFRYGSLDVAAIKLCRPMNVTQIVS